MKRGSFWVVLFFLALSQLACSLQSNATVGREAKPDLKPTFITLPANSEYVGTYEARMHNGQAGWDDLGTYTVDEFNDWREPKRVGTVFASKIVLSAKPGYHWSYKSAPVEGWYLEED